MNNCTELRLVKCGRTDLLQFASRVLQQRKAFEAPRRLFLAVIVDAIRCDNLLNLVLGLFHQLLGTGVISCQNTKTTRRDSKLVAIISTETLVTKSTIETNKHITCKNVFNRRTCNNL